MKARFLPCGAFILITSALCAYGMCNCSMGRKSKGLSIFRHQRILLAWLLLYRLLLYMPLLGVVALARSLSGRTPLQVARLALAPKGAALRSLRSDKLRCRFAPPARRPAVLRRWRCSPLRLAPPRFGALRLRALTGYAAVQLLLASGER